MKCLTYLIVFNYYFLTYVIFLIPYHLIITVCSNPDNMLELKEKNNNNF